MRNGRRTAVHGRIHLTRDNLRHLDEFIRRHMAEAGIPGLAVGIVAGNDVLWAKGYGVEAIHERTPVTPDTRFGIGSCTKAFTAAALGVLVDDGRLEWDKPLRKILPGFRLHDETATRCATLRDLILHRTGLASHDFTCFASRLPAPTCCVVCGTCPQPRPFAAASATTT